MRTVSAAQERLYGLTRRRVHVRVKIANSSATLIDLSAYLGRNWIVSVEWGEDVDAPGLDATIRLRRDDRLLSLSPFRLDARPNASGTLIAIHRELVIETAITAEARSSPASGDWVEVFRGRVARYDPAGPEIEIGATGLQEELLRIFITTPATYGDPAGEALEDVLQTILDDTLASPPTLYVPSATGAMLGQFQTEQHSLWDEASKLVGIIGWDLRYRYDDGTSAWRLTLLEPDRTGSATPGWTFAPTHWIEVKELAQDGDWIRNVVSVTYGDAANLDASGQPTPATYTATDSGSVTAYGERWMGLTYASTSPISSSAEAQRLAEAAVSDLSEPGAALEVDVPFVHFPEIGDIYTFGADGIVLGADLDAAIVGYRHTISRDTARSTLTLRASPRAVSAITGWQERSAQEGVAPLLQTGPPFPPDVDLGGGAPGQRPGAVGGYNFDTSLVDILRRGSSMVEMHLGRPGFTPDLTRGSASYAGRWYGAGTVAALPEPDRFPVGEETEAILYGVNARGVRSDPYRVTIQSQRAGPQVLSALARTGGGFRGGTFSLQAQTRGTSWAPDGWSVDTGAWATDVDLDAGGVYAYAETGDATLWLKPTSVATTLVSDLIPVAERRRYSAHSRHRSSSTTAGRTYSLSVQWIDKSLSIIRTDDLHDGLAAAIDTWATSRMQAIPPAGATYARLRIVKAAQSFSVAIDRFLFEEVSAVETETSGARFRLIDDFVRLDEDRLGDLGWTPGWLGADLTTITSAPASGFDPLSESWSWSTPGIVRLTTPSASGTPLQDYGTTIRLGSDDSPPFYGPPPTGFEFRCRVRLPTSGDATQIHAWIGIWGTAETYPDSPGMENCSGIGVGVRRAGTSGNWLGIVRDGTSETTVDLGVAASTTWRDLGWRVTPTGVQFTVDGADVGAEATSNLPSGPLMPLVGVLTTTTTARSIDVDRWALTGEYER